MELKLLLLSQRQPLTLHSPRLLRDAGKQQLALLTPGPGGWRFYPLPTRTSLFINGDPPETGQLLLVGDRVHLGRQTLEVVSQSVTDPDASPADLLPCEVADEAGRQVETERELLIGPGAECDFRLAEFPGDDPFQALLAPIEQRWHLFDLTGQGLQVGTSVGLTSVEIDGLKRVRVGGGWLTFSLVRPRDPDAEDTLLPESGATTPELPPERVVDPLYARAVRLCYCLRNGNPIPPPAGGPGASAGPGGVRFLLGWGRAQSPDQQLDQIQSELAGKPLHRPACLALARFCEEQGYLELCLQILRALLKRNGNDTEVLAALARLHILRARDSERSNQQRMTDFDSASSYLTQIGRLDSWTDSLRQLNRQVSVERTILAGGLDPT
jgi:hypothetical protein